MSYTALALLTLVGLLLAHRVWAFLRLWHIRGPRWAAWSDLWLIRSQLSGRMNFILADANTEYGTLSLA